MRTLALLYHDIVPEKQFELSGFQSPDADIYKLEQAEFRRHLETICRATTRTAGNAQEGPTAGGMRLLLTFDDGGVSALLYTAAMLEEFGFAGHFFITTERIGSRGFLDEAQIRALRGHGHIIGSHSCSHPPSMSHCAREQLDREWRESVRTLEDILGESVTVASVPGGYYSRAVAEAAARAGVRTLFNSEPVTSAHVVDGCTVWGRFSVQQGVSKRWVSAVVSGRTFPRLQRYLFWNGKKLLKIAGGSVWLSMRKRVLARQVSRDDSRSQR
jgi:peptidoglycan/xylan/chitin deacetylase (PgdA/CDA1 family)